MCCTSLLFCLIVVAGALAKPEDGCNLNLKSIFRTPKDYTKVNLDHFELLERNNFDDDKSSSSSNPIETNESTKAEDKTSNSVANAQLTLRIGGEDIHDCNKVILRGSGRPSYGSLPLIRSNDIRYSSPPSHPVYPYIPVPPFHYPGCYYTQSLPNYAPLSHHAFNTKAMPSEFLINSPAVETTIERNQEHFLDFPRKEVICTSPRPQVTLEKPCYNQVEEIVNVQNEPCLSSEEKFYIKSEPVKTTVITTPPVQEVSTPDCITINTIHTTTVHPKPLPPKIAYVEVNLADAGKACLDTPRDNIATLLDQALVPLSCQKCSQNKPLLVSYPVVTEEKTICSKPQEEVIVTECPTCNHNCDSCNRERNPNIPYGERFSKDVDSLFEIMDNSPEVHVPSTLYNEALPDSLIRIQPCLPLRKFKRISTIVPAEASQREWSFEKIAKDTCESEEIATPCCEITKPSCSTQEIIQEQECCETITIEPPCKKETVTVQLPVVKEHCRPEWCIPKACPKPQCETQQVIEVSKPSCQTYVETLNVKQPECHNEWVQPKPCVQEEVAECQEVIETPCETRDVIEIRKPCCETEWVRSKPCQKPCHQRVVEEVIEAPCETREVIEISKPCCQPEWVRPKPCSQRVVEEVLEAPCETQQVIEVSKPCCETEWVRPKSCQKACHQRVVEEVIEAPCETREVIEISKPSCQTEWVRPKPCQKACHQRVVEEVLESPCETQQVIEVSKPCCQTEWVRPKPCHQRVVEEVIESPCETRKVIEVSKPCCQTEWVRPKPCHKACHQRVVEEVIEAPCETRKVIEVSEPCCQTEWVQPKPCQKHCPETVVECQEVIETPCETQQVIEVKKPCSQTYATTVETPCPTKPITVEKPHCHTEWSAPKLCPQPCPQKEIVYTECPEIIEAPIEYPCVAKPVHVCQPIWEKVSYTVPTVVNCQTECQKDWTPSCPQKEIVHYPCEVQELPKPSEYTIQPIFKKPHTVSNCQTDWSAFAKPWPQRKLVEVSQPSCTEEYVQVSNPRQENVECCKEVHVQQPITYTSGYNTNCDSHYVVDVTKSCNEAPKVYVDGCQTNYGTSYHSNPLRSIIYKQPTVVQSFQASNHATVVEQPKILHPYHPLLPILGSCKAPRPITCVEQQEQSKCAQPHIYKIVAKYDAVPRGVIKSLNIPDLVPTNQYVKVNVPTVIPQTPVCQKEFVPVDRVPIIKNVLYIHGWPFWRNVPVQREVPLAPNYISVCNSCAKYRGELNELTSYEN